jgi:siroheme synthase
VTIPSDAEARLRLYLAGTGDPKRLTFKGLQALAQA